jgi:hypothetical protein
MKKVINKLTLDLLNNKSQTILLIVNGCPQSLNMAGGIF